MSHLNGTALRKKDIEAAEAKPRTLRVNPELVPAALTGLRRWVCWRWVRRRDRWGRSKWTKPPVDPTTGRLASSTNPETWGTFDEALAYLEAYPDKADGIGIVLGDGLSGVDLDDCRNLVTGEVAGWALDILRELDSYPDVSPTATGVKVLLFGELPPGDRRRGNVEMYSAGRYFTICGHPVPGGCLTVEARQRQLEALHRKVFDKETNPANKPAGQKPADDLGDDAIIALVAQGKWRALWEGGTAAYDGDASRADLALVGRIAYFVGPDPSRIDRIFRLSGLYRPKWDERRKDTTYRAKTIAKALKGKTRFYEPRPKVTVKSKVEGDGKPDKPPSGVAIIPDFFRERYRPVFHRGSSVYCEDGSEVPMTVACAVPDSHLITALEGAKDAPRLPEGGANRSRLPGFFKTWSKVAWGDLLRSLPDEDNAALGDNAPACEEFRRLVREAMLSEVVLGDVIGRQGVTQTERRSLIGWCQKFAAKGPWRSIRSKQCWCRLRDLGGGEVRLQVAIRHELFSQLHADKRLSAMGSNTFARRAARYKVGTSTRDNRPHGRSAVTLDDAFVADLVASLPDDTDEECGP